MLWPRFGKESKNSKTCKPDNQRSEILTVRINQSSGHLVSLLVQAVIRSDLLRCQALTGLVALEQRWPRRALSVLTDFRQESRMAEAGAPGRVGTRSRSVFPPFNSSRALRVPGIGCLTSRHGMLTERLVRRMERSSFEASLLTCSEPAAAKAAQAARLLNHLSSTIPNSVPASQDLFTRRK